MTTKKRAKPAEEKKQGVLDDEWQPKVPKEVQNRADAYSAALTAKNEALGELNTARDCEVIAAMKEHDCERVTIKNGEKILVLTSEDKVKVEKIDRGEERNGKED